MPPKTTPQPVAPNPASSKPAKPAPSELLPVNWPAIEPLYRAGLRSVNSIAKEFGVSRTAITKHAAKKGWLRDLKHDIHEKADRLVAQAAAQPPVHSQTAAPVKLTDAQIIDQNAEQLSVVRLQHRADILALRTIIQGLTAELAFTIERPDLFAQVQMVLTDPDEPAIKVLEDAMALVASLPNRTKVAKDLADALHKCIGMEREAFGLNTDGGTDGKPLVIIKDYCGRGDPDSLRGNQAAAAGG